MLSLGSGAESIRSDPIRDRSASVYEPHAFLPVSFRARPGISEPISSVFSKSISSFVNQRLLQNDTQACSGRGQVWRGHDRRYLRHSSPQDAPSYRSLVAVCIGVVWGSEVLPFAATTRPKCLQKAGIRSGEGVTIRVMIASAYLLFFLVTRTSTTSPGTAPLTNTTSPSCLAIALPSAPALMIVRFS